MHTKVSNSSSSTTSTTENNIYDTCKTTENVHTDNNNLGSSESGKYDILMLHDSICREIDIQRLHRNSQSQRKWFKQVAYTAVEAQKFSDDISYANTVVLHVGLNDLKVCSADDAFYEYEITVNKLLKKTDCLLLSCVTPVKYERLNEKVAEFNEKIKSRFSKVNNIRISFNSNFINDGRVCVNLYKDAIRLSPQITSVLASYLKKCLFKVGNLVRQPYNYQSGHRRPYHENRDNDPRPIYHQRTPNRNDLYNYRDNNLVSPNPELLATYNKSNIECLSNVVVFLVFFYICK